MRLHVLRCLTVSNGCVLRKEDIRFNVRGKAMFEKVDFVTLMVSNMEAAVSFYRDVLGAKLKEEGAEWTSFALGDTELTLQQAPPDLADERHVKYGFALGFKVKSLEAAVADLKGKDAHFLMTPRDTSFGRYVEIVDPDGHIIMVVQSK
jgi:lactoylglutathione lyase